MMRRILFALAILCLTMSAQARMTLAKYPVYLGNGQMQVAVVPLINEKKALIQVSGVNHPVDEIVFLADIKRRDSDTSIYQIIYDGRPLALLVKGKDWSRDLYQVYLPGSGTDGIRVAPLQPAPKEPTKDFLLARYTQQTAAGRQAELATFKRQQHIDKVNEYLVQRGQHGLWQPGYHSTRLAAGGRCNVAIIKCWPVLRSGRRRNGQPVSSF